MSQCRSAHSGLLCNLIFPALMNNCSYIRMASLLQYSLVTQRDGLYAAGKVRDTFKRLRNRRPMVRQWVN